MPRLRDLVVTGVLAVTAEVHVPCLVALAACEADTLDVAGDRLGGGGESDHDFLFLLTLYP